MIQTVSEFFFAFLVSVWWLLFSSKAILSSDILAF